MWVCLYAPYVPRQVINIIIHQALFLWFNIYIYISHPSSGSFSHSLWYAIVLSLYVFFFVICRARAECITFFSGAAASAGDHIVLTRQNRRTFQAVRNCCIIFLSLSISRQRSFSYNTLFLSLWVQNPRDKKQISAKKKNKITTEVIFS